MEETRRVVHILAETGLDPGSRAGLNVWFRLRPQPVNATFYSLTIERGVVNEAKTEDLLLRGPKSVDVGPLAIEDVPRFAGVQSEAKVLLESATAAIVITSNPIYCAGTKKNRNILGFL